MDIINANATKPPLSAITTFKTKGINNTNGHKLKADKSEVAARYFTSVLRFMGKCK